MTQILSILEDPKMFEDFSMFCFAKNGTYIETHEILVDRRLEPLIVELLKEYAASLQKPREEGVKIRTHKLDRLSRGELKAIRASLDNCMFNRRRSYTDTFVSSMIFNQEFCREILQQIETVRITTNNMQVSPYNPLVGIMGYDSLPKQKWSRILNLNTMSDTKPEYAHGELLERPISFYNIDIDAYHPFVWMMLKEKRYFHLQRFLKNFPAANAFINYCEGGLEKAQARMSKFNSKK